MKDKLIKGVPNYLFNSIKEYRNLGISKKIIKNWRMANEGDWTYTDDRYICQILKKSKVNHPKYKTPRTMVRTVCGTFICEQKTHSILGKKGIAQNIYSFSGNYKASYSFSKDRKLKTHEFLFIKYIILGMSPIEAYSKAYKSVNKKYIKSKVGILLQTKRVRKMIDKEIINNPDISEETVKYLPNLEILKEVNKKLELKKIGDKKDNIYFIKAHTVNKLKVGTSINPEKRLKGLQTANPYKLELIAYYPGGKIVENKIFKDLEKYHVRGEWYQYCAETKEYIKKYKTRHGKK